VELYAARTVVSRTNITVSNSHLFGTTVALSSDDSAVGLITLGSLFSRFQ
jgi:hypothetical protein